MLVIKQMETAEGGNRFVAVKDSKILINSGPAKK